MRHKHRHQGKRRNGIKSQQSFHGSPKLTFEQQEALEQIWRSIEREGEATSATIKVKMDIPKLGEALEQLETLRYITRAKGKISLTETGEQEASNLIRKNRLAEALFTQVFEVPKEIAREIACQFEHIAISDDASDAICTFLGHPPSNADGRPIPPGPCCAEGRKEVKPMVKKLTELEVGEEGKVVFLRPSDHSLHDRLSSYGIVPGAKIRVHQKKPSLVILFDGTTMAMENEVAKDVLVRTRKSDDNE